MLCAKHGAVFQDPLGGGLGWTQIPVVRTFLHTSGNIDMGCEVTAIPALHTCERTNGSISVVRLWVPSNSSNVEAKTCLRLDDTLPGTPPGLVLPGPQGGRFVSDEAVDRFFNSVPSADTEIQLYYVAVLVIHSHEWLYEHNQGCPRQRGEGHRA